MCSHFQIAFLFLSLILPQTAFSQDVAPTPKIEFNEGEKFSIQKAMMVLFGNFSEAYSSTYSPGKIESNDNFSNKQLIYMPFAHKEVTQDGNKYIYLLTYALPSADFLCHACGTLLGIYVFKQGNGRWELTYFNPAFEISGEYGTPPDVTFIKIGEAINAILFLYSDYSFGTQYQYQTIFILNKNKIIGALDIQSLVSSECAEGDPEPEDDTECIHTETDLYSGSTGQAYYTIKAITTGRKKDKKEEITSSNKTVYYNYNNENNKYEAADNINTNAPFKPLSTNLYSSLESTVKTYFETIKNKGNVGSKGWPLNVELGINQLYEGEADPIIKYYSLQEIIINIQGESKFLVKALVSIEEDKASLSTWDYSFELEKKSTAWEISSVDRKRIEQ